jgi:hypothetical protein
MAGVRFKAVTSEISTGTSAKTIMQLVAAANHGVLIDEISVSFKGTSNTASPVLVQVVRQGTAGTMSSIASLAKDPADADETLQVAGTQNATVEPTTTALLISEEVHPQTGYTWQAPFGRQIKIGGGTRLGIVVTASADVQCVARVCGEE